MRKPPCRKMLVCLIHATIVHEEDRLWCTCMVKQPEVYICSKRHLLNKQVIRAVSVCGFGTGVAVAHLAARQHEPQRPLHIAGCHRETATAFPHAARQCCGACHSLLSAVPPRTRSIRYIWLGFSGKACIFVMCTYTLACRSPGAVLVACHP